MNKCSKTRLEAEWLHRKYSNVYTCSNCSHAESHKYPPRSINLGRYCPECGAKMNNPTFVPVNFRYV